MNDNNINMDQQDMNSFWQGWHLEEVIEQTECKRIYKAKNNDTYSIIKVVNIPEDDTKINEMVIQGKASKFIEAYIEDCAIDMLNEVKLVESLKACKNIVSNMAYKLVPKAGNMEWKVYTRSEYVVSFSIMSILKKVELKDVLALGIDISKALEYCEKLSVIHANININNIFVAEDGTYKLGNFTIPDNQRKITRRKTALVNEKMMAPEILHKQNYGHSVDTYSLGKVMQNLLNTNKFMSGESLEKVLNIATADAPEDRFESAKRFRQALEEIMNGLSNLFPIETGIPIIKTEEALVNIPRNEAVSEIDLKEIEKQKEIQVEKQKEIQIEKQKEKQIEKQKEIQIEKQKEKQNENRKEVFTIVENEDKKPKAKEIDVPKFVTNKEDSSNIIDDNKSHYNIMDDRYSRFREAPKKTVVSKTRNLKKKNEDKKKKNKIIFIVWGVTMIAIILLALITPRIQNMIHNNKIKNVNTNTNVTVTTSIVEKPDDIDIVDVSDGTDNTDGVDDVDNSNGSDTDNNTSLIDTPDFVGNNMEEAEDIVTQKGLKITSVVEYSNDVAKGIIISQQPIPNEKIEVNSSVAVIISAGMEAPIVPNLVGLTVEEATKAVEDIGLILEVTSENSSTIKKDSVISQNEKVGAILNNGDSITIVASLGNSDVTVITVKMPNLVGKTLAEAENAMKTAGLRLKLVEKFDNVVKQGLIVNQGIAVGTQIADGSTVTAVISKGKEQVLVWSEWSDTLPQGITSDKYNIESITKYQYRDKETKTSSESSLTGGWIKYASGNAWSEWSDWSTNPSEAANNREINNREVEDKHNKIVYTYSRWKYTNNLNNVAYNYADVKPSDYESGGAWEYTKFEESALAKDGTLGSHDKYSGNWFNQEKTEEYVYSTYHNEYQHRDYENMNYFYRWTSWSNWSDAVVKTTQTREVNTQKMYRYIPK